MLVYLASPYHHADPDIMRRRYLGARDVTAKLIQMKYHIYSPIVHNHEMAVRFDLPRDFDFWIGFDLDMLGRCDEFWMLCIDGWQDSKGMKAEHVFALEHLLPIKYVNVWRSDHTSAWGLAVMDGPATITPSIDRFPVLDGEKWAESQLVGLEGQGD